MNVNYSSWAADKTGDGNRGFDRIYRINCNRIDRMDRMGGGRKQGGFNHREHRDHIDRRERGMKTGDGNRSFDRMYRMGTGWGCFQTGTMGTLTGAKRRCLRTATMGRMGGRGWQTTRHDPPRPATSRGYFYFFCVLAHGHHLGRGVETARNHSQPLASSRGNFIFLRCHTFADCHQGVCTRPPCRRENLTTENV
ncbi:MAG: hypothetical protein JWR26_3370 [Pedosphaera sp.]|nr:hypothetical protein [Pedosphaera sp.]